MSATSLFQDRKTARPFPGVIPDLVRYRETDVAEYLEGKKEIRQKVQLPSPPVLKAARCGKHSRQPTKDTWLQDRLKELKQR